MAGIEDTSAPRDSQVTFSPDYRDRRVRKAMTPSVDYRHLDGTTIHPDIAGWSITKHNQNDSFMMMHRWNHAGKEPDHLRVSVKLDHHYNPMVWTHFEA